MEEIKNVFIYNPESGNGKIIKHLNYIVEKLETKFPNLQVVATNHPFHAFEVVKFNNFQNVIISGGDGTINEVINAIGYKKEKPTLGIIPTGTVNDVARSLCIPRNIKKAVDLILNGEPFDHDIFKVNNRFGIYVCCTGLFSKTSYTAKRKDKKFWGRLAYFVEGVKEIFKSKPIKLTLETPTEKINVQNCSFLLILNSRSAASFLVNKHAKLNDGIVEVVAFKTKKDKIRLIDVFRVAKTFIFGLKSVKNKNYTIYKNLSHFKLHLNDELSINLDGEKANKGSFNFEVIKKGVKIIVNTKNKLINSDLANEIKIKSIKNKIDESLLKYTDNAEYKKRVRLGLIEKEPSNKRNFTKTNTFAQTNLSKEKSNKEMRESLLKNVQSTKNQQSNMSTLKKKKIEQILKNSGRKN